MSGPPAMPDIHRALVDFAGAGRAPALAVILKDTGSTPRKAGTKALIDPNGAITGTIGGGSVEAEAQRRAVEAIRSGRPLVFDFAMEGSSAAGAEPVCGGSMRILIDPTAAKNAAAYGQAVEAGRNRRSGVLLTSVRHGRETTVDVEWFAVDSLPRKTAFPGGEAVRSVLAGKAPHLFVQDDNRLEVLAEPLVPPPLLVIAGGGHIGQALAAQAALLGFDIVVIDDRREFLDAALYPPGIVTRCGDIAGQLAALPIDGDTFIAIVTRGHQHDERALAACIHRPAAYVGMIGSRRKVAILRKDLLASGAATEEEFARVYAPIGLDIGAETAAEIAASIAAQLIAVRRKGSSPRMPIG
jgi:xanthine dehydrogenase accessory factor